MLVKCHCDSPRQSSTAVPKARPARPLPKAQPKLQSKLKLVSKREAKTPALKSSRIHRNATPSASHHETLASTEMIKALMEELRQSMDRLRHHDDRFDELRRETVKLGEELVRLEEMLGIESQELRELLVSFTEWRGQWVKRSGKGKRARGDDDEGDAEDKERHSARQRVTPPETRDNHGRGEASERSREETDGEEDFKSYHPKHLRKGKGKARETDMDGGSPRIADAPQETPDSPSDPELSPKHLCKGKGKARDMDMVGGSPRMADSPQETGSPFDLELLAHKDQEGYIALQYALYAEAEHRKQNSSGSMLRHGTDHNPTIDDRDATLGLWPPTSSSWTETQMPVASTSALRFDPLPAPRTYPNPPAGPSGLRRSSRASSPDHPSSGTRRTTPPHS